jgi:hypothetical protein
MAKILFSPVGIVGGLVAGLIGKNVTDFLWSRVSDQEAPEPEHQTQRESS